MVGVFQNALERTGIKENDRRPEKSSAGVEVAGAVGRPTPYQARNPGRPAPQGGSTQIRFFFHLFCPLPPSPVVSQTSFCLRTRGSKSLPFCYLAEKSYQLDPPWRGPGVLPTGENFFRRCKPRWKCIFNVCVLAGSGFVPNRSPKITKNGHFCLGGCIRHFAPVTGKFFFLCTTAGTHGKPSLRSTQIY